VRVSVVVPAFQEEDALRAFARELGRLGADEVVFVDDGSTDGTRAAIDEMARGDARVRAVAHGTNRGVGAAMRTGFEAATGDVVVVYDADRTYPMEDVERLVAAVGAGADVASATPAVAERVPWFRRLLTWGAARSYRRALGPAADGIRTFTCAFRAYRREWMRRVAFESDGFPAAAEILGRALLAGARVVEVESRLSARREGVSKMKVGKAIRGHRRVLRILRGIARDRAP
jgi:dolichol-phosphate mannosyltransferase